MTSWKKTLAPLLETLERKKGMENTWSLQGNPSFSFKLLCLCDRCRGQVHRGSAVLHRRWIWLLLSEEEQCKTIFSRFADFGLVFRKCLSQFQQMIAKVWSQKGHEDYKRGQFPSPVVSEPIYCLFQRTERLNLGEINVTSRGYVNWNSREHLFPSYMKYALECNAEYLSNLL